MQGVLDFIAQYGNYIYVNLLDVDSLKVTGDLECEGPAYFESIETGSLTVGQYAATWQSKTVVTNVTSVHTVSRKWMYQDAQGNPQTQSTTMVTSVSDSSDTIYYLGRANA